MRVDSDIQDILDVLESELGSEDGSLEYPLEGYSFLHRCAKEIGNRVSVFASLFDNTSCEVSRGHVFLLQASLDKEDIDMSNQNQDQSCATDAIPEAGVPVGKVLVAFAFNEWIEHDKRGPGRTLGFVALTIRDGDGDETTFKNLKIRLNPKGEPSLCAPSQRYKNSDGDPRNSTDYGWDDALYARYLGLIFAQPEIIAALETSSKNAMSLDGRRVAV